MTALPYALPSSLPGDGLTTSPLPATPGGGVGGSLTPILELCAQSLALLISQYQDSPILKTLICLYLDQVQAIDDATSDVYARVLDVENAEGVHLDLLGRIVGEDRAGRADYLYRRGILTRILVNRSQGRVDDLAQIVRVFLGLDVTDSVDVQEVQPARVEVRARGALIVSARDLLARLRRAKAAGVALQSITYPPGVATPRVFKLGRASAYPEKNTTTGLSRDAVRTHGGYLPHVLA